MKSSTLFLSLLAALMLAAPAHAEDPAAGPWQVEGDVSVDYSNYQTRGDASASPYNKTGDQVYTESSMLFSRELSPYQSIKGRMAGVYNQSDYRSQYKAFSLEQFSTTWENGESSIPYVVDAGDFYASFSPRSMQLPLKGANIELQPSSSGAWSHSINLMSGFDQGIYRDVNFDKSVYAGASWLAENEAYGSFIVNNIYNYKKPSTTSSRALQQNVTSVGASTDITVLGQQLSIEKEVGLLNGDTPGATAATPDMNQTDVGLFTRIEGRNKTPLTYSVLLERYGAHYQPAGGSITGNQSHLETQVGWRFDNGLRLTGRQNRVESSLETSNPLTENTYGTRLTGPLLGNWVDGLSGSVDASMTHLRDEAVTTHAQFYTAGFGFQKTLTDDITARYDLRYRKQHNNVSGQITQAHDHRLGADYRWMWGEVSGAVSPGVTVTESQSAGRRTLQYGPDLAANAVYGGHAFNVNYKINNNEEYIPPSNNIFVETAAGRYSYTSGIHTVTFSGDYFRRAPTITASTDAWRLGVNYTMHFSNAPDATAAAPQAASSSEDLSEEAVLRKPDLGMTETALVEKLKQLGRATSKTNGVLVVRDQAFSRIHDDQRIVYEIKDGKLARHGVIFEPSSDTSSALEHDYRTILSELVRVYGRPTTSSVEGAMTDTLAADLASGTVRRVHEWQLPDRVLRFGLPRHMNNKLRLELVGAPTLPSINNPVWGFDRVD